MNQKKRTPKEIDNILNEIGIVWKKYPQLRFGQLLANVCVLDGEIYYISDKDLIEEIKDLYDGKDS